MNATPVYTPIIDVIKNTKFERVVLSGFASMQEAVTARREFTNRYSGSNALLATKTKEEAITYLAKTRKSL